MIKWHVQTESKSKIVNRNEFVFESALDEVSKQNQHVKREMQPRSRGRRAETVSNYLRSGSHAGKQRPEDVGAVGVVRLLAIYRASERLRCRASSGLCAVYGSPDVTF